MSDHHTATRTLMPIIEALRAFDASDPEATAKLNSLLPLNDPRIIAARGVVEQGLSEAAGGPVTVSFTPHLMPMNRGILSTIYVRLAKGATADDLRATLSGRYGAEPFVHVLPEGGVPHTRHVRGSNLCLIGVVADRAPGRAILLSVTDNLVKGASGQAIQNMNLATGLPETAGLSQEPLFP